MIDYKWRTSSELPVIDHVVLETPFPSHRFHAVGVGEISTSPGPSAILMAVSNAIGAWIHEYPMTPDRILKALGKTGSSGSKPFNGLNSEARQGGRKMKPFKHYNARSIKEAIKLLAEYDGKAKVNAGGTDLLGAMRDRCIPEYPELLINIKTINGLDYIKNRQKGTENRRPHQAGRHCRVRSMSGKNTASLLKRPTRLPARTSGTWLL